MEKKILFLFTWLKTYFYKENKTLENKDKI